MRVIRKYANRRLYDTSESRYVTLEDIRQLIVDREEFRVEDSKTGEDLTRNILLQIITEQENRGGEEKGGPMFSNKVLQQLIRFYGDSMQNSMSGYLEQSISTFMEQQKLLREQMQQVMKGSPMQAANPMEVMRKVAEQNLLLWKTLSGGSFAKSAPGEADETKDPQ
ncbi:polyhydroxyalkanoate synthesis repressor PhaR [Marinospirillum alkaliphilum]|uniref:Polyhydroxyalkanoate synthesis repressor PhaR n=1 Tax=Marinospirillum alkaliphilum DSM 21637 TaxID=1122209 RepID=A0A1K1ZGV1_9GAMM|nr:polyhydroxyalkanoate synthesis repressor PhaR [Marinospirillum alkaliphilum]SFX72757.1 polyhydroxyalkanoate synthesis repressor PhaR [Marinospirillum alkaliphilum DSM 21637]